MISNDRERVIFLIYFVLSIIFFGLGLEYDKTDPVVVYVSAAEEVEEEAPEVATTEEPEVTEPAPVIYKIVIDAGHGGNDSGVGMRTDSGSVHEKKVNLKIARYMKAALEQYDNVEVFMTRDKDKYLSLDERTELAVSYGADYFISIHNNSLEGAGGYAYGCTACVAMGNYKEELGIESQKLGCNFVYELSQLGLHKNGLVMRSSHDTLYENGRTADYYANIRNTLNNDIVGIIVEHAFLDNPDDFYDFLSTDEQLQKLGEADARALARYLQLPRKDTAEILPSLTDYKVKIHHFKKNGHTKRYYRVYYKTK